jgi:cysteine desulfurase
MKLPVYLDHHATTPVDERVLEAMLPYFREEFGNAASRSHVFGWKAEAALEAARERVAKALGGAATEIVFTSGATEANNLAIKGVVEASAAKGRRVVTAATEHPSVLDVCRRLERDGRIELEVLAVDAAGRVDLDAVRAALRPGTVLLSLMLANNEIGTIHPVAEIGRIAKAAGVVFHCDATQAVGKIPIDVQAMNVDLLSASAHKVYGPKGVGALWVRRRHPRVRLSPQIDGGGHERGLRSGTPNVPGIVGFGIALEIAVAEMDGERRRVRALRDRLWASLASQLEDVTRNGPDADRLDGNLNVSIPGIQSEALLVRLKDVAVSAGSACASASGGPSHVLRAIGLSDEMAHASIRFGIGRFNTQEEIDWAAARVAEEAKRLRDIAPCDSRRR